MENYKFEIGKKVAIVFKRKNGGQELKEVHILGVILDRQTHGEQKHYSIQYKDERKNNSWWTEDNLEAAD